MINTLKLWIEVSSGKNILKLHDINQIAKTNFSSNINRFEQTLLYMFDIIQTRILS